MLCLCGVQLVLRSVVLTVLDLNEVDVTPRIAEVFGPMQSGVGGSAGGWRCCWGAPSLPQFGLHLRGLSNICFLHGAC